jgi:hypothetical protein
MTLWCCLVGFKTEHGKYKKVQLWLSKLKVGGRKCYQVGARAWERAESAHNVWGSVVRICLIDFAVRLAYLGTSRVSPTAFVAFTFVSCR